LKDKGKRIAGCLPHPQASRLGEEEKENYEAMAQKDEE
jgi:hypothetical protein